MRVYTVVITATASPAAIFDLCELTPADDVPIQLISVDLGQGTDLSDANEEELAVTVVRGHTTSGSGGASATPVPSDHRDAAAVTTAEIMNTTIASVAGTIMRNKPWYIRGPFLWVPVPEERPRADQGNTTLVIRCSAPGDAVTVHGEVVFAEL